MSLISEDTDPSESRGGASRRCVPQPNRVTFNRLELNRILNLYGRMVADGEWRDYAIDFLKDRAVFSVFRRASEMPIYRIEKDPRLARKQGMYSVISGDRPDPAPRPRTRTCAAGDRSQAVAGVSALVRRP